MYPQNDIKNNNAETSIDKAEEVLALFPEQIVNIKENLQYTYDILQFIARKVHNLRSLKDPSDNEAAINPQDALSDFFEELRLVEGMARKNHLLSLKIFEHLNKII